MCGIIGVLNNKDSFSLVVEGLEVIKNRGVDGVGVCFNNNFIFDKNIEKFEKIKKKIGAFNTIGHCLHSIVGFVPQPLMKEGIFATNSEIYNWKELNIRYRLNAENDSEVIFKLLEKEKNNLNEKIVKIIDEFDGVYSFCYLLNNNLYLVRDILGIKPLWYSHSKGFAFASEKKSLEKMGFLDIQELSPRRILVYDAKKNTIQFIDRDFFSIAPEINKKVADIEEEVEKLIAEAVKKRIPNQKFGILFSGGIDSTLIAFIAKKLGKKFICYTAVLDESGMKEAEDLIYAKKVAKLLHLRLKIKKIKLKDVENYLKKIIPLIEDTNVVKVGVGLTMYVACELAKRDKVKVIFSGLGSEEIFAGYERHRKSEEINKECLSGLIKIYERDTYRDDVITMNHNIELRLPFLDKKLVDYTLKIPAKYKIEGDKTKIILRRVAKNLGLPEEVAERRKKAAQYGSKFDKALEKLTHNHGFKLKSEYLKQFYPSHNLKLAALISSGKDSLYATYVMKRQNYEISCLVTIQSKNPYSYMFHTPNVHLVELQAKAMNIPLVKEVTEGKKETELKDLEKALEKAKELYKVEGVITGALYSDYQRGRIEKVCDKLGLKIFSPLWHINQETELREIINNGFLVVITQIAADGLNRKWLGKILTEKDVDILVELNKKIGLNIAFEGGEAETLVLNCPLFKHKIVIKEASIIMENDYTGIYKIIKAELE